MISFFSGVGFADGCALHEGGDGVSEVALCAGLGRLNIEVLY